MDAICQPVSADHAEIVLRIVKANGGSLESLADLNDAARDIAVQLRIFPLTSIVHGGVSDACCR